jgi:hypothetical protein
MRRIIIPLAAVALLAAACTQGNVFDLAVGDCFDDPSNLEEVTDVPIVECSSPHDNEVYLNHSVSEVSTYPGTAQMGELADEVCLDAFQPCVGRSYETSELEFGWLTPTSESWRQGDRIITCFLYDLNFAKLTGSMKGSAV